MKAIRKNYSITCAMFRYTVIHQIYFLVLRISFLQSGAFLYHRDDLQRLCVQTNV